MIKRRLILKTMGLIPTVICMDKVLACTADESLQPAFPLAQMKNIGTDTIQAYMHQFHPGASAKPVTAIAAEARFFIDALPKTFDWEQAAARLYLSLPENIGFERISLEVLEQELHPNPLVDYSKVDKSKIRPGTSYALKQGRIHQLAKYQINNEVFDIKFRYRRLFRYSRLIAIASKANDSLPGNRLVLQANTLYLVGGGRCAGAPKLV